jgi:hypothetical protein
VLAGRIRVRDGGFYTLTPCEDLDMTCVTTQENEDIVYLALGSWFHALADSPLATTKPKPKAVNKFWRKITSEPLLETVLQYSSLADTLASSATVDANDTITSAFIPEFTKTPVFCEYLHWFRTRDSATYRYLQSFCQFMKKVNIVDDQLQTRALRSWEAVEERLASIDYSWIPSSWSYLMDRLLPQSVGIQADFGRNGPGYTAEGVRGETKKFSLLRYHPRLDVAFTSYLPRDRWVVDVCFDEDVGFIYNIDRWNHAKVSRDVSLYSDAISVVRFVPKTVKIYRTICMEPATFMYFQQMFLPTYLRMLYSGALGSFVDLTDQERNQVLAQYGSLTGRVDTLDQSAASDSVGVDLVRVLFPKRVLVKLLGTRTSSVKLPDGTIRKVHKFAPMGSAMCFPTQTIIFSMVILLSYMAYRLNKRAEDITNEDVDIFLDNIRDHIALHPTYGGGDLLEPFSVYGDDMIYDHKVNDCVLRLLKALGFAPNESKSFFGRQAYRESCGEHYLHGDKVTPTIFRVKHFEGRLDTNSLESFIASLNNFGDAKLHHVRSYMINVLLDGNLLDPSLRTKEGRGAILFSADKRVPFAIYSTLPRNNHLSKREWVKPKKGVPISPREEISPEGLVRTDSRREEVWRVTVREVTKDFGPVRHLIRDKRTGKMRAGRRVDVEKSQDAAEFQLYRYDKWWRAAYSRNWSCYDDAINIPEYDSVHRRLGGVWTPIE